MVLKRIKENLTRQYKALCLMLDLLKEEHLFILKRDKEKIGRNELSIQQLLIQVFDEREGFRRLIKENYGTEDLNKFLDKLNGEKEAVEELVVKVMEKEEECRVCAQRNADLAIALLDQTKELINNLTGSIHKQVSDQRLYSQKGMVKADKIKPLFLEGRY